MKTTFSKEYVLKNKGCYDIGEVNEIPFNESNEITLKELFDYLPIKDFCWFLCNACELTKMQVQLFAVKNATHVLHIYEKYNPNDSTVKDCIECTRLFLKGERTLKELMNARDAAVSAAFAVAAYDIIAASAAHASYAAASAAAYASYDAAYNASYDASYAADAAAASAAYKEMVRIFVFETSID